MKTLLILIIVLIFCFRFQIDRLHAQEKRVEDDTTSQPTNNAQERPSINSPADKFPDITNDPELAERLRGHVEKLSGEIGERNLKKYAALKSAANYVELQLQAAALKTSRQEFKVFELSVNNIIAEIPGSLLPAEIVIIGAHYDSAHGTPGANDNGTGVAGMLELARHFSKIKSDRTIRWVGFVNEEPPFFQVKDQMGSWVYARQCRQQNEQIVGVISLETIGYYSETPGSQKYPPLIAKLYPDQGNFVGFVSNPGSILMMRNAVNVFRQHSQFPVEMGAFPESVPGIGWSDHWSFWQEGYPGMMVTDTAYFRYPDYHKPSDTVDKIDFAKLALVTQGMASVIQSLASKTK